MKKFDGITMIALIITIIVLLILTTVTIQAITGENGFINKVLIATKQHEIGEEKAFKARALMIEEYRREIEKLKGANKDYNNAFARELEYSNTNF